MQPPPGPNAPPVASPSAASAQAWEDDRPRAAADDRLARRAARRAWFVVWVAFAAWLVLVATAISLYLDYRSAAVEPANASLRVLGGVVSYQPQGANEARIIGAPEQNVRSGARIVAMVGSEAQLQLFDSSLIQIMGGSAVRLDSMQVGKFNPLNTYAKLTLLEGALSARVSGALPRPLELQTDAGTARLVKGSYLLKAERGTTRLLVYEGSANAPLGGEWMRLTEGQRVVLRPGDTPPLALPLEEDLLRNGDFRRGVENWVPIDHLELAEDRPGQRSFESATINGAGEIALRVRRDSPLDRHNQTGLEQIIDRDVRGYRNVLLRAWIRVNSASLQGGGSAGTEYPIMFVVRYVDQRSGEPSWIQGFYYRNEENRPVQHGHRVPQGEWARYEVDLMQQTERPALVKSLKVYGAGHDFDAQVAGLQLIAQ